MTCSGDHVPEMPHAPLLDDATIDAILDGVTVPPGLEHLAAFAAGVMAVGRGPAAATLARAGRFLAHGGPPPHRGAGHCRRLPARAGTGRSSPRPQAWPRRQDRPRHHGGGRRRGRRRCGRGAAGPAGGVVRDAIEVVTPVEFTDTDDGPGRRRGRRGEPRHERSADAGDAQVPSLPGEHGDRVSSDATGESDGDPGVDGPTVAEQAPGASKPADRAPRAAGGTPPSTTPQGTPGGPAGTPGATATRTGRRPLQRRLPGRPRRHLRDPPPAQADARAATSPEP